MKTRILVVDDQDELRRLVKLTLEMLEYQVEESESGEECLNRINVVKPSLVVLDAMMPGRYDGYQTCEIIKQHYPEIKVVMLTARAQQSDKSLGKSMRCDEYITKPFSPIALQEIIKRTLS
ncbi:response regulator transcription factor [Pontibacterium sp.]|uniref:response regulator transcription factor n=1 Tax=Pontibacterium sp. TaxID=2036026 RepID=UPI0035113086